MSGREEQAGTVLVLAGELDVASAPLLAGYLETLGPVRRPRIVADLTDLEFCDCAGLAVLLRAHRRALAQGGWLRLAHATPKIRRLLSLTKLTRTLVCHPSVADAFAGTVVYGAR